MTQQVLQRPQCKSHAVRFICFVNQLLHHNAAHLIIEAMNVFNRICCTNNETSIIPAPGMCKTACTGLRQPFKSRKFTFSLKKLDNSRTKPVACGRDGRNLEVAMQWGRDKQLLNFSSADWQNIYFPKTSADLNDTDNGGTLLKNQLRWLRQSRLTTHLRESQI